MVPGDDLTSRCKLNDFMDNCCMIVGADQIISRTRRLVANAFFVVLINLDKMIRLLGQGTFGKVVECFDRDTGKQIGRASCRERVL